MYVKKDIARPSTFGSGAPVGKDPNVIIAYADDILTSPPRDGKGVKMLGDFVFKPGASMYKLYMTPSKQDAKFESEGEEDELGFKQMFSASHPGNSLEINEFVMHALGRDIIIFFGDCTSAHKVVFGAKCSPMKLKPGFQMNNDATKHTFEFEQYTRTALVMGHYFGNLVFAAPTETDVTVDITVANGTQFNIEELAVTASIEATTIDQPHGTYITFIGKGGAAPATLANGSSTAATFVLKDGTTWTALEDATITFKVFDDGTTIFLIEENRT